MADRFDEGRRALDEVAPTRDLWAEARRRAAGSEVHGEPGRRRAEGAGAAVAGRRRRPALALGAAAAVAAGAVAIGAAVRTGPVGVATTPTEATTTTTTLSPDAPCAFGAVGDLLLEVGPAEGSPFQTRPGQFVAHADVGGTTVEVHVPGVVVSDLLGERVDDVTLPRSGPAQVWTTADFVQVRSFPNTGAECDSFTVTVSGGTEAADRELALAVAADVTTVETDAGQVGGTEPEWSATPEGAALAFAREALGWDDAEVRATLPLVVGRAGSGAGEVVVRVQPLVGGRYRVVAVDPAGVEDGDTALGVRAVGGTVLAESDLLPAPAVARRVRFDYGGATVEGPLGVELAIDRDPGVSGSVLVLFLDGDGEVVGALGRTLPPGDFAAG